MRAYRAIVVVSLRQLLGRRRLIGLGLLGLLPAVVAWFSTADVSERLARERFHEAPIAILFLIVVPIVALIFGSTSLGDERRDGTLSFLTLRPVPRWLIAAAKISSAWLATLCVTSVGAGLAAAAVGVRIGDYSMVVPAIVGTAISGLTYVSVFMLLGYLTSRAVLIGLAYLFIWESGISFAAASLANASLFRIGVSAYGGMVPESLSVLDEVLGVIAPGLGGALAKAIGIAAACVAASAYLLKRTDQL